jgi:hypothetical protein
MRNEYSNRLDRILNAALRDYSNAEPRAGLELRILRHVQTRPQKRSEWRLAWALVVAAIGLIVFIALPVRRLPPSRPALLPPAPQATDLPGPPSLQISGRPSRRRRKDAEPLPLTAEERALLRLVQDQPGQAEAILSQPAEIEIEALTIEPLKIEELQ